MQREGEEKDDKGWEGREGRRRFILQEICSG